MVHRRSCGSGDPAGNPDISRWVKGQALAAQNTREGHRHTLKATLVTICAAVEGHIASFQQRMVHRRSCGSGDPAGNPDISRWVKGQAFAAQNTREGHRHMLRAMLVTICAAAETALLDGRRTTGDLAFRTSESIAVRRTQADERGECENADLYRPRRVEFNH